MDKDKVSRATWELVRTILGWKQGEEGHPETCGFVNLQAPMVHSSVRSHRCSSMAGILGRRARRAQRRGEERWVENGDKGGRLRSL